MNTMPTTTTPRPPAIHAVMRRQADRRPPRRLRSRAGFTLMEVIVALGVFLIGFVAAAAIFPVGSILQRNTLRDLRTHDASRNALSLLTARKFDGNDLDALQPTDLKVHEINDNVDPDWGERDLTIDPSDLRDPADRDLRWHPLIRRTIFNSAATRRTLPNQWLAYIFILEKVGDEAWPDPPVSSAAVSSITNGNTRFVFNNNNPSGDLYVRPGDQLLDSNGVVYTAIGGQNGTDASGATVQGVIFNNPSIPDRVWFGVPIGDNSRGPTRRIVILGDVVD